MIYVLDTNIIINSPNLSEYKGETVYIPIEVMKELDRQKTYDGEVGFRVRSFFRKIKKCDLSKDSYDLDGVTILNPTTTLEDTIECKIEIADHWFVNSTVLLQNNCVAHTSDFALYNLMRLKGRKCEYIDRNNSLSTINKSYKEIYVDENEMNTLNVDISDFGIHEYVLLINNSNDKHRRLTKVKNGKLVDVKKQNIYGLTPKNLEQTMLVDSLLDDDIKVIILSGVQGSGKTVLALAGALEQTVSNNKYDQILLSKSQAAISRSEEVGFLKGDLYDKMNFSMCNYFSNLEFLNGKYQFEKDNREVRIDGRKVFEGLQTMEKMDFLPLDSVIGSSFDKKFILVDEAQSLNINVMRSVLTRIKDNSKLVIMGDIKQMTSGVSSIDESGLYMANKLLNNLEGVSVLTLSKITRGDTCRNISERLNEYGI